MQRRRSFALCGASNDIDDVIALIKAGKGSTACPRLGQQAPPAVPAQDDKVLGEHNRSVAGRGGRDAFESVSARTPSPLPLDQIEIRVNLERESASACRVDLHLGAFLAEAMSQQDEAALEVVFDLG